MKTINKTKRNGHKPIQQLAQSGLELLPLIMNNIPQAVFWKDRDLVYLGCNRAFAEDTGFSSPEEIIGKTDFDMPWKEQAELYRADDRLVMESGESKLNYEEPQTTPEGSTIWLSTSKIPVRENSQVVAVLGMYEDITERKQAEEALKQSEEKFRVLSDQSPNMTFINVNGRVVYANQACEQVTGYTVEEFCSPDFNFINLIAPEHRDIVQASFARHARGVNVEPYDFTLVAKDGKRLEVIQDSRLIVYEGQRAILGICTDITERKKADEAIHENEERFRRFTEATIEGLVFHEQGKIVDANPAAIAMFGFSDIAGLIGRNLLEFIAPDSHEFVLKQMQLESVQPYEIQGIRKDGSTFPIETSTRAYRTGNHTIRASSLRDITERKQAEQTLQESEARYSAVVNQANDGVIIIQDNIAQFVNKVLGDMLGYIPEEMVGTPFINFVAPESKALLASRVKARLAGEDVPPVYEARLQRKDGMIIDAELSAGVIQYRGKSADVGIIRDITERKRVEQERQTAFERRGRQVQLSTQVSQSVAAATSLEDLYQRVVIQVKEQFGYYHAQLLRYDAAQNAVVLITGYGETGAKMLADRHRLPMGQGLIGTAAASGETVLRAVLENDPNWQPNPLLPETKGEIAIPIKLGDAILGVLDVQSNVANALDADDQLLLEGLCGQIAIAIESTRLRQEMADRLEEINRLYRAMSHEGWQTYRQISNAPEGFMFDQSGLKPIKDVGLAEELFSNLPLTVPGGEVIGTLAIADDPQRPITPEDQTFLQQVSEQVALALESARLFEQTQSALNESKEAEETVRASEAKLSEALDIAKLANWEYDVDRDRFIFNDHFYSIFHTTAEQMGGYELSSAEYAQRLVHPDDVPMVGAAIEKALASTDRHYSTQLEHRVIYADSGIGYISVEVHIDRDDQGKIVRYYGANQDITERRLAEEAVRASEAKLSEALKIAKLANWEYDVERDRFMFNDHFYSIFHTTVEQMGGYEISSAEYAQRLVHPDDVPMVGAAIEKALASTDKHYSTKLEHRVIYADGGIGYISVEVHIDRDEQGKIIRYYGANQDITDRKLAEEAVAICG